MQEFTMKPGQKNKIIAIYIRKVDTEVNGIDLLCGFPQTGLAYDDIGNSNKSSWRREGSTTITEVTATAGTLGTYASGSFKEIDATKMPGLYEYGVPNAAIAHGGARYVDIAIPFATTVGESLHIRINLVRSLAR